MSSYFTLVLRMPGTKVDLEEMRMIHIPKSEVDRLTTAPLRWLCALAYDITGEEGRLFNHESEVDYDDHPSGGEYYYVVHSGSGMWEVHWVDRYIIAESVTERKGFWDTILTRDSECPFTGFVPHGCQAAHLVPVKRVIHMSVTRPASARSSNYDIVSDINDIRNGLLVTSGIHQMLNKTSTPISILCTPTWKLENQHVPPRPNSNVHQNHRNNPTHHLMTLQCFNVSQPIQNLNASLEWGECQSTNPSKLILDYLYACSIIKLWGFDTFKTFLETYTVQNTEQREHNEQKKKEKTTDETKQAHDKERNKRAEAREETDVCDVMGPQALWNFKRMAHPDLAPTFEEEQLKRQEVMKADMMDKVREWQQSLAGL